MRIVQWILMILGWWSGGLLLSTTVIHCRPAPSTTAQIDPRCPKLSTKCWIASLVSLICGLAWHFVMGLKNGFASGPYLTSVVMSAMLGAAVARILCPK
jgi:hypothetical protein